MDRTANDLGANDVDYKKTLGADDGGLVGKAKQRASFKPVSVRVRTSLSTRVSVDVRKKNFEARDFGLFEA